MPNILNEEDLDSFFDKTVLHRNFEQSGTENATYESVKDLKHPQEYDWNVPIVNNLADLKEEEMIDPRMKAIFKGSQHANRSFFKIGQDYYGLTK